MGALVDLRISGQPDLNDPLQGDTWGKDRQIWAQLLIELLTGVIKPKDGQTRALRVRGARITGSLDLEAAELLCPLSLPYRQRALPIAGGRLYPGPARGGQDDRCADGRV
jgi:hypothetical protein